MRQLVIRRNENLGCPRIVSGRLVLALARQLLHQVNVGELDLTSSKGTKDPKRSFGRLKVPRELAFDEVAYVDFSRVLVAFRGGCRPSKHARPRGIAVTSSPCSETPVLCDR